MPVRAIDRERAQEVVDAEPIGDLGGEGRVIALLDEGDERREVGVLVGTAVVLELVGGERGVRRRVPRGDVAEIGADVLVPALVEVAGVVAD